MERNTPLFPKKLVVAVGAVYLAAFFFFQYGATGWIDNRFGFPVHSGGDSGEYFVLAKNLLESGVFTLSEAQPYAPEVFRSPGYPAFLALILGSIGQSAVSLVQLLLAGLTGFLIFDIAKEFVRKRYALLAAFIFWFNPTVLFYSVTVLSDTLFVFLEVLAFWFIVKRRDLSSHFLAFVLLGFGALVRPAGSYLAIIFAAALILMVWREVDFKKALTHTLISLLGAALIIAPWSYRNYRAFGSWEISSIGPYTLLFFDMLEFKNQIGDQKAEKGWLKEIGAPDRDTAQSGIYSAKTMAVFKHEVLNAPLSYITFHLTGSARFFALSGLSDVFSNFPTEKNTATKTLEWIERLFMALLALGMLLAPILAWQKDKRLSLIFGLAVAAALYMALVIGPIPNARYRLAALPFIALPAAYALEELVGKRKNDKKENSTP